MANRILQILIIAFISFSCTDKGSQKVDVLIIGGGASGTTAGIQAARMGVKTLIIEEYEWLGGALTSAGVSAVDGNYRLPSGLFGEFRTRLVHYYGSEDSLKKSWVSSVAAEPSAMNRVFRQMVSEEDFLTVWYHSKLRNISRKKDVWIVEIDKDGDVHTIEATVLIDGTELGDVAKKCGVGYDIGMEARSVCGESIAPETANDIIQDLTYVAIVKDYGYDVTIEKPEGYDPSLFYCTCRIPECTHPKDPDRLWNCDHMLAYGKLPNNKYMINWPIEGNDYYLNLIEKTPEERQEALKAAKNFTMCYLYYMQTVLGFNTIGLANDEYPTADRLPFIPYHRESRRIHGLVRFNLNHITDPYIQPEKLYRTAIAVGDYPVDHHHDRYQGYDDLPNLYFYPVPSYGLPMGTLIPEGVGHLLVTEKSISVSNLANGTTRLQPVLMQIGQAAGVIAALSVRQNKDVNEVAVRDVQRVLLDANGYLLPYLDLPVDDKHFKAIQRIGATGILRGRGVNAGWSNQTWFDTDSLLCTDQLKEGLLDFYPQFNVNYEGKDISVEESLKIIFEVKRSLNLQSDSVAIDTFMLEQAERWGREWGLADFDLKRNINRKEFAVMVDFLIDPFNIVDVDIKGIF